MQDKGAIILVATDAAGEGINLQRAHLMVNYDLPWKPQPDRAALRAHQPYWPDESATSGTWSPRDARGPSLRAPARKAGRAAQGARRPGLDVLSDSGVFADESLRDLLLEAIRYGEQPEVPAAPLRGGRHGPLAASQQGAPPSALWRVTSWAAPMWSASATRWRGRGAQAAAAFYPHIFAEAFSQLGGKMSSARRAATRSPTCRPRPHGGGAARLGQSPCCGVTSA